MKIWIAKKIRITIRVTKLLENSGVLIYRVDESVKHEIIKKKQGGGFLGMLLGTFEASMFRNILIEKGAMGTGKGI